MAGQCNVKTNAPKNFKPPVDNMPVITKDSIRAYVTNPDEPNIVTVTMVGYIGDDWDGISFESLLWWQGITNDTKEIHVFIHSGGGSMFAGIAMYNFLKNHPAKVFTYNMAMVGSAATLPFLAGDVRVMQKGTAGFIHDPWTCACFNRYSAAQQQAELTTYSEQLIDIYADCLKLSRDDITKLMKGSDSGDGTIFRSDDALTMGFATTDVLNLPDSLPSPTQDEGALKQYYASLTNYFGERYMSGTTKPLKLSESQKGDDTVTTLTAKLAILQSENDKLKSQLKELKSPDASVTVDREAIRAEVLEDLKQLNAVHAVVEELELDVDIQSDTSIGAMREVLNYLTVPNALDSELMPDSVIQNTFDWYINSVTNKEDSFDDVVSSVVNPSNHHDDDTVPPTSAAFSGLSTKTKRG